jgi:hypothetical protein
MSDERKLRSLACALLGLLAGVALTLVPTARSASSLLVRR